MVSDAVGSFISCGTMVNEINEFFLLSAIFYSLLYKLLVTLMCHRLLATGRRSVCLPEQRLTSGATLQLQGSMEWLGAVQHRGCWLPACVSNRSGRPGVWLFELSNAVQASLGGFRLPDRRKRAISLLYDKEERERQRDNCRVPLLEINTERFTMAITHRQK